jgi:antitoxin (DNA-binding transcriptional repressor) of toxin-antitoxin stability system
MSISTAARTGISGVVAAAADHRIVLTDRGRPIAVVDAPERLDGDLRRVRDGTQSIIEAYGAPAADGVADRALAEVCARLGLDATRVRERVALLREGDLLGDG